MHSAAILTGDLIGSTEAGAFATEQALAAVAQAAGQVGRWSPTHPPRFTRFRGDGWQFSAPLSLGPRAVLYTLATLTAARGLHSRISLGLGTVETWGSAADLSAARGPALLASGRALDRMRPGQILELATCVEDLALDPRDLGLMALWAALARRWTPEQAAALQLALLPQPPTQKAIAARLGISPQAVSQRLQGAEAEALRQSLARWEAVPHHPTEPA